MLAVWLSVNGNELLGPKIVPDDKHWLKNQIPSNILNLIKKIFWIFLSILRIILEIF